MKMTVQKFINGHAHVKLLVPATDAPTGLWEALQDYFVGRVASNSYAGSAWVFSKKGNLKIVADTNAPGGKRFNKTYSGQSFILTAPFGALSALGRATARQFKEEDQ